MSDLTRIQVFKDKIDAKKAIKFWQELGYTVAVLGPTDAVEFSDGPGGEEDPPIWESGTEDDWYVVIATKSKIEVPPAL